MGPRQQWRASERVDNRAADPCRMLDSTTRLPSLCFLSAGPGLSSGSSTALRAYLTVPAWQRSCAPMSVPKVTKASAQLSLCGEGARGGSGERSGRMEEIIWHTAPCLRPVDLEMRRSKHDCRMISFSLQVVSLAGERKIFVCPGVEMNLTYRLQYLRSLRTDWHWIWCRCSLSPQDTFQRLWGSSFVFL